MEVVLGRGKGNLTGPLQDGICIRQSFKAKASVLESVSILFSTYKRSNPGTVVVEVKEKDKLLSKCVFPASKLVDNSYKEFPIQAELVEGCEYEIKISTRHCRSGMSPTAHYGSLKGDGYLFVGPRLIGRGELCCKVNYSDGIWTGDVLSRNDSSVSSFLITKPVRRLPGSMA